MRLNVFLVSALGLLGLQHYIGLVELDHKPYYAYDETHYPSYAGERWDSASIKKLKQAHVFVQKTDHANAHVFEMGPQFYRLNDAEKQGAMRALRAVYTPDLARDESIFIVDCYTGDQVGTYSDLYGIILH